jgi:hypothetical protein
MRYLHKCPHYKIEVITEKPINESNRVEHYVICENELKRVYEVMSINTSDGFEK